jgi:hypothetical protein
MRNKEVEWQNMRTSRTRFADLKSLKTHKNSDEEAPSKGKQWEKTQVQA